MYSNSCLQYFYTGLALTIFAGWWFVWSLHILSIIYGRLRLYRTSSHKKYDDYGPPTYQSIGARRHSSTDTVVQIEPGGPGASFYDQLITTSSAGASEAPPNPTNPTPRTPSSCQEPSSSSWVVVTFPVTSPMTSSPCSVVTARHPHHLRSYSMGCGPHPARPAPTAAPVGNGSTSGASLPPGHHVTAPPSIPNGRAYGKSSANNTTSHYRSLSGGAAAARSAVYGIVDYYTWRASTPSCSPSSSASSSPYLSRGSSVTCPRPTAPPLPIHDLEHAQYGDKTIPGVTVIKPLMGVDPNLYHNLETFFLLDYPKFEISFCIQDYQDPSIMLVKRLMDKYCKVDATLYLGGPEIVINSKINNMLPAYNSAKYELILISDAGIKMMPNSLTDMVNTMTSGVGLVHQMPFTTDRSGFPGTLEKVYFGTAHARIYLVSDLLRINCCTGMSSLMRKSVLDARGGLASFGCYLAEDYFFAQAFRDMGWRHRISTQPAMQNAGDPCVKSFHERIIRWTKLRFAMVPVTIFFEPLSECLLLGLITSWAVYWLFEWNSLIFFMVHSLAWFLLDFTLLRIVQHGRLPFNRFDYLIAWMYRELSALPLFLIALNTSVLRWKNKTYRLKWGGYVEKTSMDSLVY